MLVVTIVPIRNVRQPEEHELPHSLSDTERLGLIAEIHQLQRELPLEARVNEACCLVNDNSFPANC
jgi:hypothetical protein